MSSSSSSSTTPCNCNFVLVNGPAVTPAGVATSADGAKKYYCINNGQIYTSDNYGATWTARQIARAWQSIACAANGVKVVACVYNGLIFTSTDSGVSWTAHENTRNWRSVACSADGMTIAACGFNTQIHISTDGGLSWTARETSRAWQGVSVSADGTKLVAVGGAALYISIDGGVTWSNVAAEVAPWASALISGDGSTIVAVDSNDPTSGDNYVRVSTDDGATWLAANGQAYWTGIAVSYDGATIYAGNAPGGGNLLASCDRGNTWTSVAINGPEDWGAIVCTADGGEIIAVGMSYGIYIGGCDFEFPSSSSSFESSSSSSAAVSSSSSSSDVSSSSSRSIAPRCGDGYAILICNSNSITDDNFDITLDGQFIGEHVRNPIWPPGPAVPVHGLFLTTDSRITLNSLRCPVCSLCNEAANLELCDTCAKSGAITTSANLLPSAFSLGTHTLTLTSTQANGYGNYGRVWVFKYAFRSNTFVVNNILLSAAYYGPGSFIFEDSLGDCEPLSSSSRSSAPECAARRCILQGESYNLSLWQIADSYATEAECLANCDCQPPSSSSLSSSLLSSSSSFDCATGCVIVPPLVGYHPPVTVNGVNITATFGGAVASFNGQWASCGVTAGAKSVHLGAPDGFLYTLAFDQPVQNITLSITGTGHEADEEFTLTANGAPATITALCSCFTNIVGNKIISGAGAPPNIDGKSGGGGGAFLIENATPFTQLAINGPGGWAGSLLNICTLTPTTPSGTSSSSAQSSSSAVVTGPLLFGFIDEANKAYVQEAGLQQDVGRFWEQDVDRWNTEMGGFDPNNYLVFDIATDEKGTQFGAIWPKYSLELANCELPGLPIPEENIVSTFRPPATTTGQDAFFNHIVASAEQKYGSDVWAQLAAADYSITAIVDNSGSMTRDLVGGALDAFESFLDAQGITYFEYSDCPDERWVNWAVNVVNGGAVCSCNISCFLPELFGCDNIGSDPAMSARLLCLEPNEESACQVSGGGETCTSGKHSVGKLYQSIGWPTFIVGGQNQITINPLFDAASQTCWWFIWEDHRRVQTCGACYCQQPTGVPGGIGSPLAYAYDTCAPDLITQNGETFWYCDLGAGEFNGVGADMGVQWAPGFLEAHAGCTLMLQVFEGETVYGGYGVGWRLYECGDRHWTDVSATGFVSDGAVYANGYWSRSVEEVFSAPYDANAHTPGVCISGSEDYPCVAAQNSDDCRALNNQDYTHLPCYTCADFNSSSSSSATGGTGGPCVTDAPCLRGQVRYRAYRINCNEEVLEDITGEVFTQNQVDYISTMGVVTLLDGSTSPCAQLELPPLQPSPAMICAPFVACPATVPQCGYPPAMQPPIPLFNKTSWASIAEPWKSYLDQAADRWMAYVQFDQTVAQAIQDLEPGWSGISLNALDLYADNAPVIASCGPSNYVDLVTNTASVKFNTVTFDLNINTSFQNVFDACDWIDVLTHELGHALGIGVYWQAFFVNEGAVVPVDNFLDGAAYTQAQAAYNDVTTLTAVKLPLEDGGGAGTVSAHWEPDFRPASAAGSGGQAHYGLFDELMVGFYDPQVPLKLSKISIQALVDFGYQAVSPGAHEGDPTMTTNFTLPMTAPGDGPGRVHLGCKIPVKPHKIGIINLETKEAYIVIDASHASESSAAGDASAT